LRRILAIVLLWYGAFASCSLIDIIHSVQQSLTEAKHMAHIADFMVETKPTVGLNNYIARELSPNSPHDASLQVSLPIASYKYHGLPFPDGSYHTGG
jgi:hypothetical protein